MNDFYDDPLVYDILHNPGTAREVDGLERIALRYTRTRSNRPVWLEPACGTGRYLRVAAQRGIGVVGFDLSPAMIAYARPRVERAAERATHHDSPPPVRLFTADMTSFDDHFGPRRADFAFNTINTIRHLDTDDALLAHLDAVRRSLRRGGVYAVGLSLTAYGVETPSEDIWTGARGRTRVSQIVQYLPADRRSRRERVMSHLIIDRPCGTEHRDQRYTLRSYDRAQWESLVTRSSMRTIAVVDESGDEIEPAPPGYMIYLLAPADA